MVIGQYSGSVGSGNRVSFPRKFSKVLGNDLLVTKGMDGNLIMVAGSEKELLIEGIETKPYANQNMRNMQAFVLGNTFEVTLDSLNRFVIPEVLRSYAGITSEVIFAGIEHFVQVWDKKRWEEYQDAIQPSIRRQREQLPGKE